jgi:hypothetical protein
VSDFDDAIGGMTDDLLTEAGESCIYIRGTESTTITLRRSPGRSQYIDNGNGGVIEIRPTDWIARTSALPYAIPQAGDIITVAGKRYELQPFGGEKVFRVTSPQMTRLHSKQVQ